MKKTNWKELAQRFLKDEAEQGRQGRRLEARIGTLDFLSEENLAEFRECSPETLEELSHLLEDIETRQFVKLVTFTAEEVPKPLFAPLLLAAARTRNPTFNKHFVAPCMLCFGRRPVMKELIRIYTTSPSKAEKAGAVQALYWGSMGKGALPWPHKGYRTITREPDEPVDDIRADFQASVLSDFLTETDVEIRKSLITNLPKRTEQNAELFDRVVAVARASENDYIRSRLRVELRRLQDDSESFAAEPAEDGEGS